MKRLVLISVFLLLVSSIFVLPAYAVTLDFEGIGSQVGTSYDSLGITFTPNTQMICPGLSNGDPGNWDLEGTNGPDFLCFNGGNPGYTMELNFTSPQDVLSLDVSRSNGSSTGDQFTINAYNGLVLLESQTITFDPVNNWTTITISTPGITRVTWDSSGTGFRPYGVDNLVFLQQQPATVPTMTEWGMIIFMVLAGVGSIYYMRRNKIKG